MLPENPTHGAKYDEMSRIRCVALDGYALMAPPVAPTIAMFDVMAPSKAFRVDTVGRVPPSGHSVM